MNPKSVQLLIESVQSGRGRTLDIFQAKEILNVLFFTDNMLQSYINEYGPELMLELTGQTVEGEVVDESTDEDRQDDEGRGLESSTEEEE